MLAATDIGVRKGGRDILSGVSLTVQPGELLAIIGPNGAGKSTLLEILSDGLHATRGQVSLDGIALQQWPQRLLARRRAVLPQASTLTFPFRVLEVVMMGRSPFQATPSSVSDLEIARTVMDAASVTDFADRIYTTLSGGERQRVQIARVLAQIWPAATDGTTDGEQRYLLLDEPSNNLDLVHQHRLLRLARTATERGVGVIAVLHDPNLASQYADRICVLKDGRKVIDGPPAEVLSEDLFASVFGMAVHVMQHPTKHYRFMVADDPG